MSKSLETIDLAAWVKKAPSDKKNFREAVHIILTAIGASTALRTKMVMKGGMLMALSCQTFQPSHSTTATGSSLTFVAESVLKGRICVTYSCVA